MGRRATGTVEALSSAIRLKFTVHRVRHAETLDLKPTAPNLKAAQRILAQVLAAIQAGVYRREDFFAGAGRPTATQTFAEYADEWLLTLTVEKSTRRSYTTALRATWKPALGDMRLGQVRYSDIKKAIAERIRPESSECSPGSARGRTSVEKAARPVSGKTINNHLIVLRAIFETAIADGLIIVNPTEKVQNLKHQAADPDPFTHEEMESVLADMRRRYDEQVWNWYEFAFSTGMRPSEQIVLRWPDIDWRRSKAKVERAMVDAEEKGTKTNRIREIDLSDRTIAVLKRQKAHTLMRDANGEVFHNPNTNRRWSDEQVQRQSYFIPTLRRLGLRHRDAYQTRHTFATLLLMGGVNPAYIAKQLGHASTAMVFKVYARWIDGADQGAEAAKLNAILSINRPGQNTGS
jgi:integrase